MATPFDGKILLVNWKARNTPGETIADCARLFRQKMPNVSGIMLKCSNGTRWQGELNDFGPQAITNLDRIKEWVTEFAGQGLEVHVWGVPRAKRESGGRPNLAGEAEKFIQAGSIDGVESVSLDVEHGRFYWQGTADEAKELMQMVRQGLPPEQHLAIILDGRRNRSFRRYVVPWLPHAGSLHPMIYPIMYGRHRTIEEHIDMAFNVLEPYGKPLVPMLQSVAEMGGRPDPEEIARQGQSAFERGAVGISFFRLGNDQWSGDGLPFMGDPEYEAVANIKPPGAVAGLDYSWRDVIRAAADLADSMDEDWRQWFEQAGVWKSFSDFLHETQYSGPKLAKWPLPDDVRHKFIERLAQEKEEDDGEEPLS